VVQRGTYRGEGSLFFTGTGELEKLPLEEKPRKGENHPIMCLKKDAHRERDHILGELRREKNTGLH